MGRKEGDCREPGGGRKGTLEIKILLWIKKVTKLITTFWISADDSDHGMKSPSSYMFSYFL